MNPCQYHEAVSKWLDGESHDGASIEQHIAGCPECSAHRTFVERTRAAIASASERVEIGEAQMPAYLNTLREKTQGAPRSRRGLWAFASVATAALLAALSIVVVFSGTPEAVEAETVVESVSTDIEGATARSFYGEDGTAIVWVNVPDGDLW